MTDDRQDRLNNVLKAMPETSDAAKKWMAEYLETGMPIIGAFLPVAEEKKALIAVENIERHMRELLKAYTALPACAKAVDPTIWRKLLELEYALTGEATILAVRSKSFPRKKDGATSKMKDAIKKSFSLHHKQRDAEFPAKVQLIGFARQMWREWTGEDAPRNSDSSEFCKFVKALIAYYGKDWSYTAANRAFNNFEKERFG